MRSRLMSMFFSLTAAILLAGIATAAEELAARTSSSAGVTITAKPRALSDGAWEFEIALNTHSQDLKDDLAKSTTLVSSGKTFTPASWQGDPPGGHHRKGVLKFNAVEPRPQEIELRMTRPGEPTPRSFRWQLK
jgi:hypothetical protein